MYYYNQMDYANVPYEYKGNGKTVKTSGCGPCSACIVINSLMGRELFTVSSMAKFSIDNGARDSSGTNMNTLLKAICKKYTDFSFTATNDESKLIAHIKSGGMAICNQGDSYNVFSTGGHFVVAYRMSYDNIEILDPQMYDGKYDAYNRPDRIVKKTANGCIVSSSEMGKATADRSPAYYLITYTKPVKPIYNKGSNYKLTAYINVWTKPTTASSIKKVKDLTADGKKHASSTDPNANATLVTGTVVSALGVSTDTAGNIWLEIPSGFIPVYYKGKKRANWYNN